jgi:hypothetical protein
MRTKIAAAVIFAACTISTPGAHAAITASAAQRTIVAGYADTLGTPLPVVTRVAWTIHASDDGIGTATVTGTIQPYTGRVCNRIRTGRTGGWKWTCRDGLSSLVAATDGLYGGVTPGCYAYTCAGHWQLADPWVGSLGNTTIMLEVLDTSGITITTSTP